ncbi:hypothetical protein FB446DRAFT_795733 [Lentinula raphanica]|nr:hypothetical protein FB446DRAFT_795733 [Lentinula raphanica]
MASSSKGSSSKPSAASTTLPAAAPRKKLSVREVDRLDFEAVHRVAFRAGIRELGKTPDDPSALFLPASAEECSVLVNNFQRFPNTASPAFSLRRYTHPEEVDFKEVRDQDVNDVRPDTFYPAQLTTFCSTFSTGPVSGAEGYQLYQALAFLQRGFSRIIRAHLSKAEIRRRILSFTALPNFSYSLQYYQLFWHNHQNCPLVAPLLVILICELCEDHLSEAEYATRVYDPKLRDGPGMSAKTRDRLLEDIHDVFELQDLAIPLPLDPSTREGQIIVTVTSHGSRVDQIIHPVFRTVLRPDPSFLVSPPRKAPPSPASRTRLRPPSPDFDSTPRAPSTVPRRARKSSQRRPEPFPVIDVDAEGEDIAAEPFKSPEPTDTLVIRPSIARAAKTKPKIPEEFRKAPAPFPSVKRDRSPGGVKPEPSLPEPPTKKRRTLKVLGKARAESVIPSLDDTLVSQDSGPLRIQEGPPDYFTGDDSKVVVHQRFLTSSTFQPKTPFYQVIVKAMDNNKKVSKLPFLRAPKWNISEELKDFGAFANIGDTAYSLQGLSRFGYASSRFLWPSSGQTLPSPESLHSTNNCLTCLSRGEVCDGSGKQAGACRQCNGTHRSCPSCLSLEEHRDRFLAIHNHVQGYPFGYAAALDHFSSELNHMTKLESLLLDARRSLANSLQTVRNTGFDINIVLSQWIEHNPNLVLDYDTITWLATFFGWDSSCNLVEYLATPEDRERLEEFIRNNLSPPASLGTSLVVPTPTSLLDSTLRSPDAPGPVVPPPSTRRRPAAGVPINFSQKPKTPSPVADEEMDVEDGASRNSAGPALVTEYDDSDEEDDDAGAHTDDEDDEDEPVEIVASATAPKARK